jgi:hypothetical protein
VACATFAGLVGACGGDDDDGGGSEPDGGALVGPFEEMADAS